MITQLYFSLRALELSEARGFSFNEVFDAYVWHFTGLSNRQIINSKNFCTWL